MAITIDLPADTATGTANPLQVRGTASAADFVQVRLERSDGDVWDGTRFVDDRTGYTPVADGNDGIVTTLDVARHTRFWGEDAPGNEKFRWEIEVVFTDSSTAFAQRCAGVFTQSGNGTPKHSAPGVTGVGDPSLQVWYDNGSNNILTAGGSTVVDGDRWRLRFDVDRTFVDGYKIFEQVGDATVWTELVNQGTPLDTALGIGDTSGAADFTAIEATVGNRDTTSTASDLSDGSVLSAKLERHDGTIIFDLDLTRDVDAGHADATPIVDAHGRTWTKNGGTIDRIRADRTFTALGLTDWTWTTPELTSTVHQVAARTVAAGVPSAWTVNTFTPTAVQLLAGSGNRYARRGTGTYLWAYTIGDTTAPTFAELAAAVDVTCDVGDFSGLSNNHEPVTIPSLTSAQDFMVPGVVAGQTPTLVMYDNLNDTSAYRDLFNAGAEGFLVLAPYGTYLIGDRVTVIPCISAGNTDLWTVANEPARYVVSLGVSGRVRDTTVAA